MSKIKIEILGPGFGEAILVSILETINIVIDCNKSLNLFSINNKSNIENFFGSTNINYWIITHYHFDHFQSFSEQFKRFKIDKVLVPNISDISDLRAIIENDIKSSKKSQLFKKSGLNEFDKIKELVETNQNKFSSIGFGSFDLLNQVINGISVKLTCYSINKSDQDSINRFNLKNLAFRLKSPGYIINKTGYILELKTDNFTGIFLADTPMQRIKRVIKFHSKIDFIKASHHGSKKTNSINFIKLVKNLQVKTIVITPYDSSNLPKNEVIQNYKNENINLDITNSNLDFSHTEAVNNFMSKIGLFNGDEVKLKYLKTNENIKKNYIYDA